MEILWLTGGLVALLIGAEILVRGAARIAAFFGMSGLVIGLTVVAFGTSSPELSVSVMSSLNGQTDLALGNVVGSNIFNVLFILGISALLTPLAVSVQLIRLDIPVMIGVSALVYLLSLNGTLGLTEGMILIFLLVVYTGFLIVQGKKTGSADSNEATEKPQGARGLLISVAYILGGLALLVQGSDWLVQGAVSIARRMQVSELVIGLTVIAAGTSLPEVATSVLASLRGQRDIAVGNVVGSNIFNLLGVLGVAAIVAPNGLPVSPGALAFDLPVMIAVALACLPIFFTGHVISRWEGAVFFGYYILYTVYLLLLATANPALRMFNMAMAGFVLPLTAITLLVFAVRALRRQRTD
jgi:cation:H+ antiporter